MLKKILRKIKVKWYITYLKGPKMNNKDNYISVQTLDIMS